MAGKSTLLEALSHGDGGRRGRGAQRTSRDVVERRVHELRDVVIVDVPGVGAADGAEDQETAFAELSSADVVLWVATNEAPKNDTADAIRRIAMLGKPVIVAVNCRRNIDLAPHRRRFLADPADLYAEADELVAVAEKHLKEEGSSSIGWTPLHAEAAFLALGDGPEADALRTSSRIDRLLELLENELKVAPQRRFIRRADAVRAQVVDELARVQTAKMGGRAEVDRREGLSAARSDRLRRVLAAHDESVRAQVRGRVESRRHWYAAVDLGADVKSLWETELGVLQQEVSALLDHAAGTLASELNDEDRQLQADWDREVLEAQLEPAALRLAGMGSVWANWGAKALVLGVGIALAIPTSGLSTGWSLAVLAGSTVLSAQSKRILRLIDAKMPNAAERSQRRRQQVSRQTGEILDETLDTFLSAIADHTSRVEAHILAALAEDATDINAIRSEVTRLVHVEAQVWELLGAFDRKTVQGMLRTVHRYRAAEAISRASRTPGLGVIVEVDERSYCELALFPAATVETVAPVRATVSDSGVSQVILAAPAFGLRCRDASDRKALLTSGAETVRVERLGPLTELLRRFSNVDVNVVRAGDGTDHRGKSR